jgi:hypothetical protein
MMDMKVGHSRSPYWKRAHHDWRFWVGLVLMLVAIAIYALSDDLALLPRGQPPRPAPGAVNRDKRP